MTALRFSFLLLSLAAPSASAQQPRAAPASPERRLTSVTIHQRLIIRVPRLPAGRLPPSARPAAPPIRWVEKKADKCVPAVNLAAAAISGKDRVDLILNGGKRLRARFDDDCPTLDFYSGFYVKMTSDGKLCADRDSIRSRSGRECRIESFRALVPAR